MPFNKEKINPIKLNIAYMIVNLPKLYYDHPRKAKISFLILTKLKILIGDISYGRYFSPFR